MDYNVYLRKMSDGVSAKAMGLFRIIALKKWRVGHIDGIQNNAAWRVLPVPSNVCSNTAMFA